MLRKEGCHVDRERGEDGEGGGDEGGCARALPRRVQQKNPREHRVQAGVATESVRLQQHAAERPKLHSHNANARDLEGEAACEHAARAEQEQRRR